jgi:transposase
MTRALVRDAQDELADLDQRIASYDRRVRERHRTSELRRRIGKIEGIGAITATALAAAVGDRTSSRTAGGSPLGWGLRPSSAQAADEPDRLALTSAASAACERQDRLGHARQRRNPQTRTVGANRLSR